MSVLKVFTSFKRIVRAKPVNFCSTAMSTMQVKQRLCIVGSGPAGFYAAQYLLKNLPDCQVDMIEKLPVPFGLVRYGVAPDHPEVKNVINTFTKTAENSRFRFLGNLSLGKDFNLSELREKYHAVLLTYGAEKDRKLNIPNENSDNVISARKFVGWYNGLPGAEKLNPKLDCETVTLIGQGNVAIDVARIILSPVDSLKKTDITDYALERLSQSKVKKVYLVGRRGPLQAAFTIKELREMLKLPGVATIWKPEDFGSIRGILPSLQRPRKRLTELMISSIDAQTKENPPSGKEFVPIFFRSPKSISGNTIELTINELDKDIAIPTEHSDKLESGLILRSIGYKSICPDETINFDYERGFIKNMAGRVLQKQSEGTVDHGLYAAGWVATGPTGVILTTMSGAFNIAKNICDDINKGTVNCTSQKSGLNIKDKRVVTWEDWQKIDKVEIELGKKVGKPREKIVDIEKLLKAAGL